MHKRTNKHDDHRWSSCQSLFVSVRLDTSGMPSQDNQNWKNIKIAGSLHIFKCILSTIRNLECLRPPSVDSTNIIQRGTGSVFIQFLSNPTESLNTNQSLLQNTQLRGQNPSLTSKWKYANGFGNRKGQVNGWHLWPLSLVKCEFPTLEH